MTLAPKTRRRKRKEEGYVLLTLLLFVAILAITAAAVAPSIAFQIKRDREEELIHRGVQYSRAIRHYVKKFGRYPTRIEELENTNNLRFLRKRYKDPITGGDFKLLHLGEVKLMQGAGIPAAAPVGTPVGGPAPQATGSPTSPGPGLTATPGEGASDEGATKDKLAGQVFGGGPIVGVVSSSGAQTIREFNNKNHYNQWQFIYDPGTDRGGLLNTPAQPPLQGAVPVQGAPGAPAAGPGSQPAPVQPAPEQPQENPEN